MGKYPYCKIITQILNINDRMDDMDMCNVLNVMNLNSYMEVSQTISWNY